MLSLDQTDLGDRFAVLMLGLVVGDRALPLTWAVEAGPANLGFDGQNILLERVRNGLPGGADVLLLADGSIPRWNCSSGCTPRVGITGCG